MFNREKHKLILTEILKTIYGDIKLGPVLGFKGGTAMQLFYDLPRSSVDLDFNLLAENQKISVFERLKKILPKFGEVREQADKRYTLFFLISYKKGEKQVKIEISKRPIMGEYELKQYLGISMKVMKPEDMAGHKLLAMVDRKRPVNRDVFDVWFMLSNHWEVNTTIIEKVSGLSQKEFLKKCLVHLEQIPPRQILDGLGELLETKTKFWVREKLIQETIFLLKLRLKLGL